MKHFEVKAKTPVLLCQTNQTSYSATKSVNDFTCNRRQRTLYFHESRKNFKLTSSPSWQPCLSSQENVFKKFMLKNSAMCKVSVRSNISLTYCFIRLLMDSRQRPKLCKVLENSVETNQMLIMNTHKSCF